MKAEDWDRLAEDYHKNVISPFQRGVRNPLLKKVHEISDSKSKVIADIGCGRGEISDFLASRFRKVYMMDFSPAMINIAKGQSPRKNIEYYVKDMRNLSVFKNKFDVVISVNSVLMPDIDDVKKSMKSMHSTLKPEGEFYGIFPSMESILYQGFLILEEQRKRRDEAKALRMTKRLLEKKKYDFLRGTFNDEGSVQKFYYEFELLIRMEEAGFRDVTLSKVLYPWGEEISDFMDFPDRPWMWDWFVSAKK